MGELTPEQQAGIARHLEGMPRSPGTEPKFDQPYRITDEDVVSNLKAFYKQATPQDIEEGMLWYNRAQDRNKAIARQNNLTLDQATAITAVLSPQMEWERNLQASRRVAQLANSDILVTSDAKMFGRGGPPVGTVVKCRDLPPEVLAYHPELRSLAGIIGGPNMRKAIAIARGGDIDTLVSGPKVRNFYNNMRYPNRSGSVTVDGHMQRVLLKHIRGRTVADTEALRSKILNGVSVGDNKWGAHPYFADMVTMTANSLGIRPHQLQAICWGVVRRTGEAA